MNNITLYQLAAEHRAAIEMLSDLDLPPQAVEDTLESLGGDLEAKTQNLVMFVRNLESTADSIKAAEKQMADRRKAMENRAAHLKQYVLDAMQHNGIQKIECPLFKISVAKNPPSVEIYDEKQVPVHYLTDPPPPPPQIDKKLIAQALKDGHEVPGARLSQGVRLSIK